MPDTDTDDLLEIPAFLDRRGDPPPPKPTTMQAPKRKWIMPSPRRIKAMKREQERIRAAAKRAEAAERAAELNRKTK